MLKRLHIALGVPYRLSDDLTQLVLWFQVRSEAGLLNGFWEWPGGKVEKGETALEAVSRELNEEVFIPHKLPTQPSLFLFNHYKFDYPDRHLYFSLFLFKAHHIPLESGGWKAFSLVNKAMPSDLALPQANRPMLEDILHYFRQQTDGGQRAWAL